MTRTENLWACYDTLNRTRHSMTICSSSTPGPVEIHSRGVTKMLYLLLWCKAELLYKPPEIGQHWDDELSSAHPIQPWSLLVQWHWNLSRSLQLPRCHATLPYALLQIHLHLRVLIVLVDIVDQIRQGVDQGPHWLGDLTCRSYNLIDYYPPCSLYRKCSELNPHQKKMVQDLFLDVFVFFENWWEVWVAIGNLKDL